MSCVLIAGTGTEVGKTYVTAAVAKTLRARGIRVAVRKPVQSFAPEDATTDAEVLAAATGEDPDAVCPTHRRFPAAMAPPMAAEVLGLTPFAIADLVAELAAPSDAIVLIESAGGVRSPLACDGDTVDFADALRPRLIVLVADAGLGTINAVRMSIAALGAHPVVVFLNRFADTDLHRRNAEWLQTQAGCEVITDVDALAERLGAGA